jgi:hypothetical protein
MKKPMSGETAPIDEAPQVEGAPSADTADKPEIAELAPHEFPAAGGSYTRLPDGSLRRDEEA